MRGEAPQYEIGRARLHKGRGGAALINDALESPVHVTGTTLSRVSEFVERRRATSPQRLLPRLLGRNPIVPELRPLFREASGDIAVIDALSQLGTDWMVLSSVSAGNDGCEVEHIVIGPAGLFSIAVRHHPGGEIWLDGGVILVNGEPVPHIRDAEWQAVRVTQLLSDAVGARVDVTPCLVVVDPRSLTVAKPPRRVAILTARDVKAWLKGMPRVYSKDQLDKFCAAAAGQPGVNDVNSPTAADSERIAQFRRAQSEVSQARHLRLTWVTGALVLLWLVSVVGIGGVTTGLLFR